VPAAKKKPFPLSLTKDLSRSLKKGLVKRASRLDFVRLLKRISHSEAGRPWLEHFSQMPPAWQKAPEIIERAAELTLEQLAAEGHPAEPEVVAHHLDSIGVRYDHQIHIYAASAVVTLMNGFFWQHDPAASFLSPDRRELAHLDELKAYRDQGLGVVYLINHSSHLDEFLLATVMAQNDLGLPLFAAGDNMMAIDGIAKILWIASYVVRRRGADRAYMASLFNYCRAVAECGEQQGIFLEAWAGGARSRDGSLRYPRRLVTLRGALAGQREVVVQPVAISFSIVPEDLALAARKGAMGWLRGAGILNTMGRMVGHPRSWIWRSVQNLYGRAYVSLPKPRLLSELKAAHAADRQGRELDEYVALTAIKDIARAKKVMASQLTARGFMRARRQGRGDLVEATKAELAGLSEYHQETFGVEPDLEDFIRNNPLEQVVSDGVHTLKRRAVLWPLRRDEHKLPRVRSPKGLAYYATHGDRRIYSPTADQNVVVAGAGDWGFALAWHLGQRMLESKRYMNASLTIYDPRRELIEQLAFDRSPEGRFSEQRLPKNAFVTSDPTSAFKKASEVVVACPPGRLAGQLTAILAHAEQGLKLVVACRGLAPGPALPALLARELCARAGRGDVAVYVLAGAVGPGDLVPGRASRLVLAGPAAGREELAALLAQPPVEVSLAGDPVGVNLAGVLARVYGLWGGYLTRVGRLNRPSAAGCYLADASSEAIALCLALGGSAESFSAASSAWSAAFAASGLGGSARDFGRRLGSLARRGKELPAAALNMDRQLAEEGRGITAWRDLNLAALLARKHNVEMPILEEAWAVLVGSDHSSQ
jgi:glycerol-3-phosphate dehydrogenase